LPFQTVGIQRAEFDSIPIPFFQPVHDGFHVHSRNSTIGEEEKESELICGWSHFGIKLYTTGRKKNAKGE
jgi:hypothetical protein